MTCGSQIRALFYYNSFSNYNNSDKKQNNIDLPTNTLIKHLIVS